MKKQFKDLQSGDVFMYAGNTYLSMAQPFSFLEDGAAKDTLLSLFVRPVSTIHDATIQDAEGNEFFSVHSNPDSHDGHYDIYCDAWIKVYVLRHNARTMEVLV